MTVPAALDVDDLSVVFREVRGATRVVQHVTFRVRDGSTLGIVGESGCGKSVTLRAICDLVPPPGEVVSGQISLYGRPYEVEDLIRARGDEIAMIFQDSGATLNPVMTVGKHLEEVLRVKKKLKRSEARTEAIRLLDHVGIEDAVERRRAYPHEFSGGMRQRVMIALALAARPRILLADEPTTALDVTTQEQILRLLISLQSETGMSLVIVSHDFGVIADVCDDVIVMYAGFVVERGSCKAVLRSPRHPYTRKLLASMPSLTGSEMPSAIRGQPPDLGELSGGCPFAPRCDWARTECGDVDMQVTSQTSCACPFADEPQMRIQIRDKFSRTLEMNPGHVDVT